MKRVAVATFVLAYLVAGCSSSDESPREGAGGASGGGPGGAPSSGGGASAGGAKSSGGAASGGASSSGGSASSGGVASGGASTGGNSSTGGTSSGGTTSTGGVANTGGAGSGGRTGGADILVPPQGALLGLYYGDDSVADTATKLGRSVPVHLTYYTFRDDWTSSASTRGDLAANRIPLVNWEPFDVTLAAIIAGELDSMITARARAAKNLGKKFFLDFGAEMNGEWSPWSGAQNGSSAESYLAAYRHIHDIFVAEGATNAVWVWCPNVTDEPRAAWNAALNYYPGDAYVDWTCVDGYNWGTSNGQRWQNFRAVFRAIYEKLGAKGKPILIGEMASAEVGGDKAAFIGEIVPALSQDFPLIAGLVWFDVNKETDWRISSSATSEAAFVRMAGDPYFNP